MAHQPVQRARGGAHRRRHRRDRRVPVVFAGHPEVTVALLKGVESLILDRDPLERMTSSATKSMPRPEWRTSYARTFWA